MIMALYRTDLINREMAAKGFTNQSLAKESGVSDMTISAIRNGTRNVTLQSLQKAIEPLGLNFRDIFEQNDVLVA